MLCKCIVLGILTLPCGISCTFDGLAQNLFVLGGIEVETNYLCVLLFDAPFFHDRSSIVMPLYRAQSLLYIPCCQGRISSRANIIEEIAQWRSTMATV